MTVFPRGHARPCCTHLSISSTRLLEEVGREPTTSPRAVTEMLHFTKPFTPARVSVGSLITAHFWKKLWSEREGKGFIIKKPWLPFHSQQCLHKHCPNPPSEGAGGLTSLQKAWRRSECWSLCEHSDLKTGPSPDPAEPKGNLSFKWSWGKEQVRCAVSHTWLAVHCYNVHLECSYACCQKWYVL